MGRRKKENKMDLNCLCTTYNFLVESVAQVVGQRTQDHKVMSSSPDTGLNSKVVVRL